MLILFLRPARRRPVSGAAAAATGALVIAMIAAGCGSSTGSPAGSGIPGAIRIGASEYKFDPATVTEPSGSTTFELVNSGTTEHEFEIFQGGNAIGKINAVAPGKTGNLTVTLSTGDYTYVCRLAAHDALGMKGTLAITGG